MSYSKVCILFLVIPFSIRAEFPQMLKIPAGSFMMGGCKDLADLEEENRKRTFMGLQPLKSTCEKSDEEVNSNEMPEHKVNVTHFEISKTEITVRQFKEFIKSSQRSDLLTVDFIDNNQRGDDYPVVWVSWKDAFDYTKWLSVTTGNIYRLPTESEWEYACLGGRNTKYCGSDNPHDIGWFMQNMTEQRGAQKVAQKKPNDFGIYDMSGNVMEWVLDCYHNDYQGAPVDGSAWLIDCDLNDRVLKGGHWRYGMSYLRSSYRYVHGVNISDNSIGFRVVKEIK